VLALAPQVEPASFISKLFRFFSLPAVFVKCSITVVCVQLASEEDVVIAKMDATANDVPSAYNVRG